MIQSTVLERLLTPEKEPRRANTSTMAGFSLPALGERPAEKEWEPLLVTNMRGDLTPTKVNRQGCARYGFSDITPEDEPKVLGALLGDPLRGVPAQDTPVEAIQWMESQGLQPHHLVVPYENISEACDEEISREDADSIMSSQGFVAQIVGGVRVLAADVPKGVLVAHPSVAGFHTRSDNKLALMFCRVTSAWCIVHKCSG